MFLSAILSTYNSPDWLRKVILGYAVQRYRDFELVIADDGSTPETGLLIERMRRETGLRIAHVWHEDRGFRKCEILNHAIVAAAGDYLILSDGDCVPRSDFVRVHAERAQRGHFLSGGYFKLPRPLSERIDVDDIHSGRAFDVRWLHRQGLPRNRLKDLRLACSPGWGNFLNRLTTTRPTWNGANSSGWKDDIVAARGFDQRMEYGGLDRELGERLVNRGLRGIQIRYSAICIHLDHDRAYADPNKIAFNRDLRRRTRRERLVTTDHGLTDDQLRQVRRAA